MYAIVEKINDDGTMDIVSRFRIKNPKTAAVSQSGKTKSLASGSVPLQARSDKSLVTLVDEAGNPARVRIGAEFVLPSAEQTAIAADLADLPDIKL